MNQMKQRLQEMCELEIPPLMRVMACTYLFDYLDRLKDAGYPHDWGVDFLRETDRQITYWKDFQSICLLDAVHPVWDPQQEQGFEQKTGAVYYALWKDFTAEEYYRQTLEYLRQRFERNDLPLPKYEKTLDDGCGGGRYSLALRALGCKDVTGVDVSADAIAFAVKMSKATDGLSFRQASVLELPFEADTFDFIFSNGVLHHTRDTVQGLKEIRRVLKPGGKCWLYLYGGKDSFFWDVVETCRVLLRDVPQFYTQQVMKQMGYSTGRVFHRCDFWYVPVNRRYLAAEIEDMLKECGFKDYRRLLRGADHDWDEIIHNHPEIDPYIYGEGEMRYWIGQ